MDLVGKHFVQPSVEEVNCASIPCGCQAYRQPSVLPEGLPPARDTSWKEQNGTKEDS